MLRRMTDYLEVGRGRFWEGGSRVAEMIEEDRGWGRRGETFNCEVEFSAVPTRMQGTIP